MCSLPRQAWPAQEGSDSLALDRLVCQAMVERRQEGLQNSEEAHRLFREVKGEGSIWINSDQFDDFGSMPKMFLARRNIQDSGSASRCDTMIMIHDDWSWLIMVHTCSYDALCSIANGIRRPFSLIVQVLQRSGCHLRNSNTAGNAAAVARRTESQSLSQRETQMSTDVDCQWEDHGRQVDCRRIYGWCW